MLISFSKLLHKKGSEKTTMLFSFDQKVALKTELKDLFISLGSLPIFMCVGVDSVIVDSLGPIVGELLKNKYMIPAYVYGDLEYNITATNLTYVKNFIDIVHSDSKILVIDASIGSAEEVGYIKLKHSGVIPAGIGKKNTKVIGDCAMLGILLTGGIRDKIYLNEAKTKLVLDMADTIAWAISTAILEMEQDDIYSIVEDTEYMYI